MKTRKQTLGNAMLLVCFAAIDTASARFFVYRDQFFGYNVHELTTILPFVVTLQVALIPSVWQKGSAKIFWRGFLGAGVVSIFCVLAAYYDPPRETRIHSSFGVTVSVYPGCLPARILWNYYGLLDHYRESFGWPTFQPLSPGDLITQGCVITFPLVIISLIAGWVSFASFTRIRKYIKNKNLFT